VREKGVAIAEVAKAGRGQWIRSRSPYPEIWRVMSDLLTRGPGKTSYDRSVRQRFERWVEAEKVR
jgi:hypothetical protein